VRGARRTQHNPLDRRERIVSKLWDKMKDVNDRLGTGMFYFDDEDMVRGGYVRVEPHRVIITGHQEDFAYLNLEQVEKLYRVLRHLIDGDGDS